MLCFHAHTRSISSTNDASSVTLPFPFNNNTSINAKEKSSLTLIISLYLLRVCIPDVASVDSFVVESFPTAQSLRKTIQHSTNHRGRATCHSRLSLLPYCLSPCRGTWLDTLYSYRRQSRIPPFTRPILVSFIRLFHHASMSMFQVQR